MRWRWLVKGLGGLVGMMLNQFTELPDERIASEHLNEFGVLLERLRDLHRRLEARDGGTKADTTPLA
jgi:hypothetical protein